MSEIVLSNKTVQLISLATSITRATIIDCIIEEDRIIYVVEHGQIGIALGKKAENLEKLRNRTKKAIKFVEYSEDPKRFVRNLCKPYNVNDITLEGRNKDIAKIQVDHRDKSKLIGKGGKNINLIRTIAQRHHPLKDVQIK